ncbi:MAG: DUF1360 domain-containing protein [Planctomycetota bacterium]|jgi:hypothetical protein
MDNILAALISLGLATWRVSSLLVSEAGPLDILAKFRFFIGIRYDELSEPVGNNVIADLFTCVWCTSVWVGLLFAITWYINASIAFAISLPFALSTIAIIVDRIVKE